MGDISELERIKLEAMKDIVKMEKEIHDIILDDKSKITLVNIENLLNKNLVKVDENDVDVTPKINEDCQFEQNLSTKTQENVETEKPAIVKIEEDLLTKALVKVEEIDGNIKPEINADDQSENVETKKPVIVKIEDDIDIKKEPQQNDFNETGNSVCIKIEDEDVVMKNEIVEVKQEFPAQNIKPERFSRKRKSMDDDEDDVMEIMTFGINNTEISASQFRSVNWNCYREATRKLLMILFDRETLATHSLTGKVSNAMLHKKLPPRPQLDAQKVEDIIFVVARKCKVKEISLIRLTITHKCADEHKMYKKRMRKIVKKEE